MNSKPPLSPGDVLLSVLAGVGDAVTGNDDTDGWEHEKSKKELEDIRKEIEHLTPAPNVLDGDLLIRRNSKESEVLKGRISAQSTAATTSSPSSTKKTDK